MFLTLRKKKNSLKVLVGLLKSISSVLVLSFFLQPLEVSTDDSLPIFTEGSGSVFSPEAVAGAAYNSLSDNRLTGHLRESLKTPFSLVFAILRLMISGKFSLRKRI